MTSFFRIIKFTLQNFIRNFWLSLITITILFLLFISVNVLVGLNLLTTDIMGLLQDKIDVSIYLKPEVEEDQLFSIKNKLANMPEVKDIGYVSKEQALYDFKEKHKDNLKVLESLDEIGKNPLGAVLSIKANEVSGYPVILEELEKSEYNDLIADKNYDDHKLIINRMDNIVKKAQKVMLVISIFFAFIAIIIVFNTIRVAIYTHRETVGIMKLVGAGNWFVKMPFIFEGVLYAIISCALAMAVIYPSLIFIQPYLTNFFNGTQIDLLGYFKANILIIFGWQVLAIIALNIVASAIAIRRYLKV